MNFKRTLSAILCVLMLATSFVFTASAATKEYYISAEGADTNNGLTESKPVRTMKRVAELANALSDKENTTVTVNILTDLTDENALSFDDTTDGDFIGLGKVIFAGNGKKLHFDSKSIGGWNNFCNVEFRNIKFGSDENFVIAYTGYDLSFDKDCVLTDTILIQAANGGCEAEGYRREGGSINIDATGTLGRLILSDASKDTSEDVFGNINVNIGLNNTGSPLTINSYGVYHMPNGVFNWRNVKARVEFKLENANVTELYAMRNREGTPNSAYDVYHNGYVEYVIGKGGKVATFCIARDSEYQYKVPSGITALVVNAGGVVDEVKTINYEDGIDNITHMIINNGGTVRNINFEGAAYLEVTGGELTPDVVSETKVIREQPNVSSTFVGFNSSLKNGTAIFTGSTGNVEEYPIVNGKIALSVLTVDNYKVELTSGDAPSQSDNDADVEIISTGIMPNAAGGTAYAAQQAVSVDGKPVTFPMYQLRDENGGTTNYIKLRDLAHIINGSAAQFNVGWDGVIALTTKTAYTSPNGTEMKNPFTGDRAYTINTAAIKINGKEKSLNAFVLTDDAGGQYTYFQLRDLGQALGFNVGWRAESGIFIETDKPYSHAD